VEEHKIEFICTPPYFGNKNQLCVTNNISKWHRFARTKIKNEFISGITEWFLPTWENNPYLKADIEYTIQRKDGKKIDQDSFGASAYKWIQDALVLNGYLVDDDKVKSTLNPTQLHVEGSVETSIRVVVKLHERYTMTIDELRDVVEQLELNLAKVGSQGHNKAASAKIRKLLGEIKNATPQLRRDFIALDKA